MARRVRLDPRRAKKHHSYTIAEAARLYGVHRNTVRAWIKAGLGVVKTSGPILILGEELGQFLSRRRAARRRPCPPGALYCLRCREPKVPPPHEVAVVQVTPTSGNLKAVCPDCGAGMHRRVSLARLAEAGFAAARVALADSHLADSPNPSVNCHFRREARA